MKKFTKTITIAIILVVAILMFASFFGVYKTNENGQKVNIIPDLKLGMEFNKTRKITATVNNTTNTVIYDSEGNEVIPEEGVEYKEEDGYKKEEVKVNGDHLRTLGNYERAKNVIEERLNGSNQKEYFIDLNEETGNITIEVPENESAEEIENTLKTTEGLFILDGQNFETVFDSNNYLDKAEVVYSQGDVETAVFLRLSFNEEGKKILNELNSTYIETQEEKTNEEGQTETVTNSKQAWIILNNQFLGATVLPNIVSNDQVFLTFGMSNNSQELNTAAETANKEAMLLNSGELPLVYDFSNEIVETDITQNDFLIFFLAIGVVFIIGYIYLVIKYKAKGFISVYFQVGFLGILLLILRLTNVVLTVEGMAGIIISMLLEYIFTYIVLRNLKQEKTGMYKQANLEFFLNTFPLYILAIVFTFANRVNISSFGMVLFWGIITIYVYNFVFSKYIFENLSEG